ncbi:MAG: N-6 DNA methylase [Polyangiaceae bacterium]|nr:N-6 DNA methylase [Polyangiaceae bacterium]
MVQADVRQLLLTADLNLSADNLEVVLEAQLGDRRRIDVEVGATVIEVKKDLRVGNVRSEAVEQLKGYVLKREQQFARRYLGVITDGAEWRCYRLHLDQLVEVSATTVDMAKPDVDALLVWLEGVLATVRGIKPTPDEIRLRLGAGSSSHGIGKATLAALYAANTDEPIVKTKRHLWARLLETALGTQFEDSDELFVEHTLLVNSAEVIAHAVVGFQAESLLPASLLTGAKFDESGIHGVVEADFFDWVLGLSGGDAFVRDLARRLGRFDWSAVEHDVLKILYESVIGAETRKKLGEYYTPDWLAEQIVEEVITEPLESRVLDPACGYGTFLFHTVRRYLTAAEAAGMPSAAALHGVTSHVFGMDLHPVAVTLARVTYLLAIGKERLASDERGAIQIPIYLGDSIQWRRKSPSLWSDRELTILADDRRGLIPEELRFPSNLLKDTHRFDELVKELAAKSAARARGSKVPPLTGVFKRLEIPEDERPMITATFHMMCRLHDDGRDHIWDYYIRNLARPEWLARSENRVDLLVGNPPWLAYRYMPEGMQADFREMSEARSLWHGAQVATHQDLSALFVVRVVELYLKAKGRFGFVMPTAVLDRRQYAGFRSGNFDDARAEVRIRFTRPWDLRRLRPHFFPVTAAVVFGSRATKVGSMPSDAVVWTGRLPRRNASWADVRASIKRKVHAPAAAQSEDQSGYGDRFRQGATIVPRMLFMIERKKAGPLGQVSGRASVTSAVSANEKKPWKDLPRLEGIVETEFIRPIHLGETILPYRALTPRPAIISMDMRGPLDSANERFDYYPGFADWWRRAEACWNAHRSSERLTLLGRINFHRGLENQFPIQPQRVVYTTSGMHVAAARIVDRRAVIDHKLYWATVSDLAHAHFLCAILNAAATTTLVRPLMSYSKDERDIHKSIWRLSIPMFDPANDRHAELASLGQQAEKEVAALQIDGETHFAALRRTIRQHLAVSGTGQRIEAIVEELLT